MLPSFPPWNFKGDYLRTPLIIGAASPEPNAVVTAYGRNPVTTTVFCRCVYVNIQGGLAINVWMTAQDASQAGDSGAPVLMPDPVLDDYGYLIGHVIGGSPGIATYVQDINCRLAVSRTSLRTF